ncbi:MAG: hypothetical protein ABFE07_06530 [Armatimonadia bacterium]
MFSGPLAKLAEVAIGIKAIISLGKYLFPAIGEPHPFTPLALRLAAVVLGEFAAFALDIGVLQLAAGASIILVIASKVLAGLVVGAMALGTHEVVDMAKKPAA